ncbi:ribosomal protein S18-alanine N-acetyltransferase [Bacterioplanes sanyensis]|nr:ribosomal protein S18-alanine N-acetyltransferase [Bacterioplanes sanyensis]
MRLAHMDELAAIMDIERRAHSHPWSEAVMVQYLQRPASVWVLQQGGALLGHAVIRVIAGEGELLTIAVDPKHHGQGFGQQLLRAVLQQFIQQGAEQCFLEVRRSNTPAIDLYERVGFACAGVRKDYYPSAHGREDALIYCLDLRGYDDLV